VKLVANIGAKNYKEHKAKAFMLRTLLFLCSLFFLNDLSGQAPPHSLKITPLTGEFYVFTTYNSYKGSLISANGMYLVTNEGVVMFDTPWDTTQFQPLLDSIKTRHGKNVILCISSHFHDDRTAGLQYYSQQGIKTYTTRLTDELSRQRGVKRAEFLIDKDTAFVVGQYSFQTYYPGQGHSPDNIIIWFEKEKILYGGCLIKSVGFHDLGNLADANVREYATTIEHVKVKCKKPQYIIPGHGDWINTHSLDHTLKMAQQLKQKN
jgi:metallo-beta-lactamase class B